MKRIVLLISVLLLSASWAMAQYSGGYGNERSNANSDTSKVTVQGCLSEEGGNFTLTDQSGTTYQLIGKTEKLSAHVGHTMRVTGFSSFPAQAPGSMSEGAQAQPALSVISYKHVASNCGETSGSGSY